MPVTRTDVENAYRFLLGREPESQARVDQMLHVESVAALRDIFMQSVEFRNLTAEGRVFEHHEAGPTNIEIACDEQSMRRIVAQVSREWRKFGETEPHWSVLNGHEFLQKNISRTLEVFYASGEVDVARLLGGVERAGLASSGFANVLDFGCGVGRLVLALAKRAGHVTGVDISPSHLRLAHERAVESGVDNVDFAAIDSIDDLDRFSDFDLVTSFIVIQHNPPPAQALIIRKLLQTLRPGGLAVLQLPTYLVHATRFSVEEYLATPQPSMEMNALPQHHVFRIIEECGCRCLETREDGAMGKMPGISQTFTIQKAERSS